MHDDGIELAAANGAQQRGALNQVVARDRQQASLRHAGNRVSRPADALEERGDAVRRPDLADEVDVADVDPELQRGGRDERLERAGLEPVLGVEPRLLRETPVMRGHRLLAEPLAQLARDALRHPPRVHEHDRRLVRGDEIGEALVVLLPDFVRHDGAERRARNLDRQIDRAAVPLVHDDAVASRRRRPHQEARDGVDRPLRGGQPDPLQGPAEAGRHVGPQLLEAFQRQRQVRAAARANHRMDLVDDDRADGTEEAAAALRREQQVERLRGRDQDVRRDAQHGGALGLRGVARADSGRDARRLEALRLGELPDSAARLREVLVDVGAQRLERRHVNDAHFVGQWRVSPFAHEVVDGGKERRQRLAGAGRRGDQRVTALPDGVPAALLRGGRLTERAMEPFRDERMKTCEGHGVIRS